MAVLDVEDIPVDGAAPTLVAADAAGDSAPVGAGIFAFVRNGSAGSVTVTFTVPIAANGAVEVAVVVVAGADALVSLPQRNDLPHSGRTVSRSSSALASWTYSDETSVEIGALRAP